MMRTGFVRRHLAAAAMVAVTAIGASVGVHAAEADARTILKSMSDYLAAQQRLSFDFDASLEVVTKEDQKIGLASSGSVTLDRPDRIHATRAGGFMNVAMNFDGTTFTLLGKDANLYTQIEIPGSIDHLVDELRNTYGRPLPAADLLMSTPYEVLISDVTDVKDLGSGVVGGVECDSLAFRTEQVDWQIWIAQGDRPYPCRYVITSKGVQHGPQYSIQFRNWRTGNEVAATDYAFKEPAGATQIEFKEFQGKVGDLPESFSMGDSQ